MNSPNVLIYRHGPLWQGMVWLVATGLFLTGWACWETACSQDPFPVPTITWNPRSYVCLRTNESLKIDGKLMEQSWALAPWTEAFVDIEGEQRPAPNLVTRAKMLWDDEFLYVAAYLEEPDVWATLRQRDAVIYHDNDFEVFIDPDGDNHDYYELEINAHGTVWDLLLLQPYRDGGPAVIAWDISGLETAVYVDGTLNDPTDTDGGWSVEIALPWQVLAECAGRPSPPSDGDIWRMNFSRVQWQVEDQGRRYVKVKDDLTGDPLPESNWVWSPQGVIAMHYPEMWGLVQFSDLEEVPTDAGTATLPDSAIRQAAMQIYYQQKSWQAENNRFATSLESLDIVYLRRAGSIAMHAGPYHFHVTVAKDGRTAHIDTEGRLWVTSDP